MEKESKKPEFCYVLVMDGKIREQETNEWLTALTDDHISNFKKKTEDYFPTSEPSSAWIQQPVIAEMNDRAT